LSARAENFFAIARCIHGMTAFRHMCVPGAGELEINADDKAGKPVGCTVMKFFRR
jgi:hypothetical protein